MPASIRPACLYSVLLVQLLVGPAIAIADCLPIAYTRYVGNTTTDNQCTDNDIQSAINNSACPTTIYVSNERAWTAQHLDINNKNLSIVGRTGSCGPVTCDGGCAVPTAPVVVVDGAGHTGDSVMYIHGTSNVTLKYLDIKNGTNINGAANTYGGGIHFDGRGSLALDTTWVRNNVARFGGGINMSGTGGFAGLALLAGTRIENNTAANDGGGIRITDNTFMSVLSDHTLIWLNQAPNGYGGGIQVKGPAHADIASPGESGLGVIYSNSAQFGGGIAILSGTSFGDDNAEVQLYTVDPNRPVRLHGNSASASGGAVYLKPYVGFEGYKFASLCAFDFRIDDNAAAEGSAVYGDNNTSSVGDHIGSTVLLNPSSNLCAGLPEFAERCAPGVICNTVSGNAASNPDGSPTLGATAYLKAYGTLEGERLIMRGNNGGYLIHLLDPYVIEHSLDNCLLANNSVTRQLVRTDAGQMDVNNCTIVDNTILSTNSIYSGGALTLANTIIDQPGNNALGYGGNPNDLIVSYVLSSDVSTLPAIEGVALGRPTYVDAAAGNYRLALNSLGIDFAPPIVGDDRDLDNLPHDQDLPEVGNLYGVRDLGAYERQRSCGTNDTIFCNGFESP
ncbi:MAG: hypothetical protein IPP82_03450 [Xanthomonadales bacterium]|nr:hypothetical protein [Xanthomonadales bacterium]